MAINNELAGKRYGKLLVLKKKEGSGIPKVDVPCLCDCGRHVAVNRQMLLSGRTTDCGCIERNRNNNNMYPERVKGLDYLAGAIVERAAADYRMAYMRYLKKNKNEKDLLPLRKFFKSEWCAGLTKLDIDALVNRIEQECIIEFERKKKHGHKNQVPQGHSAD